MLLSGTPRTNPSARFLPNMQQVRVPPTAAFLTRSRYMNASAGLLLSRQVRRGLPARHAYAHGSPLVRSARPSYKTALGTILDPFSKCVPRAGWVQQRLATVCKPTGMSVHKQLFCPHAEHNPTEMPAAVAIDGLTAARANLFAAHLALAG